MTHSKLWVIEPKTYWGFGAYSILESVTLSELTSDYYKEYTSDYIQIYFIWPLVMWYAVYCAINVDISRQLKRQDNIILEILSNVPC